ncbi:unnamed protein product [Cuscuta campestris]|uniref:Pre-PUA domain-containing protein n=1 Tax=Cuscuta campestris TaxID=132261 RepID=A0A484MKW9_9ASTE|nr:unnamed protein product [Cuscuta campestris]
MFKKTAEVKSQQRISGADRKKLRRTIRERFPNVSDADIDTLLPPKAEFTVSKYPNRILVYGLEGDCPLFFDSDGRGNKIFPTERCDIDDGFRVSHGFSEASSTSGRVWDLKHATEAPSTTTVTLGGDGGGGDSTAVAGDLSRGGKMKRGSGVAARVLRRKRKKRKGEKGKEKKGKN